MTLCVLWATGPGISRSTVSRICADIDEAVAEFLARRLDHTWFPYLFVDARPSVDVRHRGRVVSQAVAVVTGALIAGQAGDPDHRVSEMPSPTDFWTQVLRGLRERGLKVSTETDPEGVALVISDAHWGSRPRSKRSCPVLGGSGVESTFARNVTQRLGSAHSKPVNALISTIFAQTTAETDHCPVQASR